jgi:hypothetical protein
MLIYQGYGGPLDPWTNAYLANQGKLSLNYYANQNFNTSMMGALNSAFGGNITPGPVQHLVNDLGNRLNGGGYQNLTALLPNYEWFKPPVSGRFPIGYENSFFPSVYSQNPIRNYYLNPGPPPTMDFRAAQFWSLM